MTGRGCAALAYARRCELAHHRLAARLLLARATARGGLEPGEDPRSTLEAVLAALDGSPRPLA